MVAVLTNATAAGTRVYDTRVEPMKKAPLPTISVYTTREPVREGAENTAPRELTRDVQVEIIGWVMHTAAVNVAKAMDNLAEEIETAMDANRFLGGEASESVLEDTEMEILEESGGDPLVGRITLTYSVTYQTSPAESVLVDFLRAKATHAVVSAVPDTPPAIDEFTVQESP